MEEFANVALPDNEPCRRAKANKWDKTKIKTQLQWRKLGLVPKAGAKPVYIWRDRNGKPKTYYWCIDDLEPV